MVGGAAVTLNEEGGAAGREDAGAVEEVFVNRDREKLPIRLLFIAPRFCLGLPPDPASR